MMINVTLEYIKTLTGLLPFDMRPGGYSPEHAYALLNALGVDGNRYYLTRQIPLDLIYPALMALTLISILKWLEAKHVTRMLTKIGVWLSIGAAGTSGGVRVKTRRTAKAIVIKPKRLRKIQIIRFIVVDSISNVILDCSPIAGFMA
jgi:hypothetical protein